MIVNKVSEIEILKRNLTNLLKSVTGGLFQHNSKFDTQIDGVNMGNPLAPNLANHFMGTLENTLFNKENENNPVIYFRYVDDIFCIFKKEVMFINFY